MVRPSAAIERIERDFPSANYNLRRENTWLDIVVEFPHCHVLLAALTVLAGGPGFCQLTNTVRDRRQFCRCINDGSLVIVCGFDFFQLAGIYVM